MEGTGFQGWTSAAGAGRLQAMRIMLFLFLSLLAIGIEAKEPLRIMTYNVWVGFNKKQTLDAGAQWISGQDVDVLALQELKGISSELLEATAKEWNHSYTNVLKRPGGWPQGLSSRFPIEEADQIQPEGGKGLRTTLYCQTAGIHFFVVHLNPHDYRKRQLEAAAVVKHVSPLIAAGERVIVLGDFNALSKRDAEKLSRKTELLASWRVKQEERPGYRAYNSASELDYSVMQLFLDAGLVDPAIDPVDTFPTRVLSPEDTKEEHEAKLRRIDYILVDPVTASKPLKLFHPRDNELDEISDHYPVMLEMTAP